MRFKNLNFFKVGIKIKIKVLDSINYIFIIYIYIYRVVFGFRKVLRKEKLSSKMIFSYLVV